MPRSSTPADRRTQATTGPAMWSSANLTTSTPHGTLSRLYHAACTLSVYASQPGSPPDHATLDSGWWPALTGQGSHLLGRVEGFRHVYPSTWLSPSPSFAWRKLGGRGQLPTRGSHGSGRAPFGHPAPQMMVSLLNGTHCARLAPRGGDRCCVGARSGPMSCAHSYYADQATCAIAVLPHIGAGLTLGRCQ